MSDRVERLSSLLMVAGVASAITMTAFAGYRLVRSDVGQRDGVPHVIRSWQYLATDGIRTGAAEPQVTIVEFADFQCPFCATLSRALDSLLTRYPTQVAMVSKQFPLTTIHPWARAAASAALCAAEQGAYHRMRSVLFAEQDSLSDTGWVRLAIAAGVSDTATFAECQQSGRYDSVIARDKAAGQKLGIDGTPTLIVNGTVVRGAIGADSLAQLISQILDQGATQR